MSTAVAANPFPARAVSTFGSTSPNLGLACATTAYRHFELYLRWYNDSRRSHAGAVGLSGGYGEGKTHALNWLAEQARQGTPQPNVLYGKADSPSFFDVYKQLMRQLPRETLVRLIAGATIAIARTQAEAAVATQAVSSRIKDYSDLDRLIEEGNVDRVAISNELRTQMLGNDDIPKVIPTMLLSVSDPQRGDSAYRWLLGNSIDDLSAFGLSHNLKDSAGGLDEGVGADSVAIDALEAVATLHRLAGTPLVLLVDQLEALVATSDQRREELFSLFKTFIEHLARQEALIYVAGTEAGWAPFRRDSIDRLYTRPPIAVGHLDRAETAALLEAHLNASSQSRPSAFSEEATDTLYELSGGNAREILQTAYETYELVYGRVENATRDNVIVAARESGSLEDRRTLALTIADEVLGRYGSVRSAIGVVGPSGERWTIDRMLSREGRTVLALLAICAADKVSEVKLSLQINEIIQYLDAEYPGVAIIVTMIGYVSAEVSSLLETTAATIPFSSDDYAGRLESRVERVVTVEPEGAQPTAGAPPDVASELGKIEKTRARDADAVAERFNKSVSTTHEPERQRYEARTVWELVQDLDRLRDVVVAHGHPSEEREIIQGVIAWNSLGRKDARLERLAGLYLELVSMSASARSFPEMSAKLDNERLDLRTVLRDAVRGQTSSVLFSLLQRRSAYIVLVLAAIALFVVLVAFITNFQHELFLRGLRSAFSTSAKFGPTSFNWSLLDLFNPVYLPAWLTLGAVLVGAASMGAATYVSNPVFRWEHRVRLANERLDAALAAERSRYDSPTP